MHSRRVMHRGEGLFGFYTNDTSFRAACGTANQVFGGKLSLTKKHKMADVWPRRHCLSPCSEDNDLTFELWGRLVISDIKRKNGTINSINYECK